ncbi:MAG: hypothetical protein MUE44_22020 [Oscillatoriaceae cyanobacterium Prado104]|jgi:hypothetical protein|nr:hypothetical protein [Oscillatoriaceae cyanobacterium Prado104]
MKNLLLSSPKIPQSVGAGSPTISDNNQQSQKPAPTQQLISECLFYWMQIKLDRDIGDDRAGL